MGARKANGRSADQLVDAIVRKLEANSAVLQKSLEHGRLSWRIDSAGRIIVKLEPSI
jgi:hypothetical protein